ncbi:MAG TPA: transcriptional repressor [Ottowia sp.]|uniref:Fur family transcriptional regulator n=1 Tax=Ottowia sp. TaxID=1898956 RepID=UPI002C225C09|nr:transcriptional repressor [Ottowia sp.]HMN22430.1 transcriptional repressor [Ottowia sp.]
MSTLHPPAPPVQADLARRLRAVGLQPTRQRLAVAALMLARPTHQTAEQVLVALRERPSPGGDSTGRPVRISRATVYATLAQFARAGLLRELHTGCAVVYDSKPTVHHHWLDVDSGEVHDLPAGVSLQVSGLEHLPEDLRVQDLQLLLRVRRKSAA